MTEIARDPHQIPHAGDVFAAPYPHDCDERLRETVRVLKTTVTEYTGKPATITSVRYQRGARPAGRDPAGWAADA